MAVDNNMAAIAVVIICVCAARFCFLFFRPSSLLICSESEHFVLEVSNWQFFIFVNFRTLFAYIVGRFRTSSG